MGAQYSDRVLRKKLRIAGVSAVLAQPARPLAGGLRAAILLAHGAGADMDHPFLCAVHEGLALRGAVVLKFNFAYTEAGRKAPDRPQVLLATLRAARDALAARPEVRGLPLVLSGKSMGGRIASHAAALGDPADGLVFFGYPLHPIGWPKALRDAHLGDVGCPMLFIEGTRDPLCDLSLLRPVLARLSPRTTLHVIEDGDHSFHVRRSSGRTDGQALEEAIDAAARWIARLKASGRAPAAGGASSRAASSPTRRAGTKTRAASRARRT